ncbi:MAG: pilus assembly protein [Chloroflexi bacterium]|nr:pilus assembly protein [Chloroflexota bacterium]
MLFLPREDGQGLVEYALILVLVSITVIVILGFLGDTVGEVFSEVGGTLNSRP